MILIFMVLGSQRCDLLLRVVGNAWVHDGAAQQHGVGIEVFADVHVALHDGVEGGLVDSLELHAQEGGLEDGLRAAEALIADDLPVGQLFSSDKGEATMAICCSKSRTM